MTMICPDCRKETGEIVYVDEIPCEGCGDIVKVFYCSCDCGFSWREVGGKFLDGGKLDPMNINQLLDGMNDFFENVKDDLVKENPPIMMEDLLHHCIKCGGLAIEIKPNLFECVNDTCGFSWERDPHE